MGHTLSPPMHELKRTIRFSINPEPWADSAATPRHNTFGGWPSIRGFGRFYELEVHCSGSPGPATGYIVNASDVDSVVRSHAIPLIAEAVAGDPSAEPADVMPSLLDAIAANAPFNVHRLIWHLTPYHALAMNSDETRNEIRVTADFDFAASHRLDSPEMSAEENRRVFGKCNNPNGHGHNYRLRPCVAFPVDAAASGGTLARIEQVVHDEVLQRFDHKHLNHDVPEFNGINPSVEHITRICFELLEDPIKEAGGRLVEVTVWETDKTSCTYSGTA